MSEHPEGVRPPHNQPGAVRPWAKLGYLLLALSVPALLEICFEVVLLTISSGPQMLFYSIIHTGSGPLMLILGVSLLVNPVFTLYALGLLLFRAFRNLTEPGLHFRIIMGGFIFQILLVLLLFTYDYWAYALFK